MLCHICDIDFPTLDEFAFHIKEYHSVPQPQQSSESEESEEENAESEESEEENADVSDHNIPAENKSDDCKPDDNRKQNFRKLLCHLCNVYFPSVEEFSLHLKECHSVPQPISESEESEHENADVSEIESDDGNAASDTFEGNGYDSDRNVPAENKSNDSRKLLCHLCMIYLPKVEDFSFHIKQLHSVPRPSSESGESEHENAEVAESDDDGNAASDMFEGSGSDSDRNAENKSDNGSASPRLFHYDSDHSVTTENNSHDKTVALYKSPSKVNDKASFSSTLTGKRKQCNRKNKKAAVKTSVSNEYAEKQIPSILKKCMRRRKKKVAFSEKVLSNDRLSTSSDQKDSPKHSDNNETGSSFNGDSNHVNYKLVPSNNFVNPINNYVKSQPISNNNPVFVVSPHAGPDVNNYAIGNQAVQQPLFVLNKPFATNLTTSNPGRANQGAFSTKYIGMWLNKHKELCKNFAYPLPRSSFIKVQTTHKAIFNRYCMASANEESRAVLKVYEELDCMIHKHVNSINNTLNIL